MFDASFKELLLILVLGLLVLGPERLPKVAAEIGKWVARARRTAMQLRRQLEREIELDDAIQSRRERERREAAQKASEDLSRSASGEMPPSDAEAAEGSPTSHAPPPDARDAPADVAHRVDSAGTSDEGISAQTPAVPAAHAHPSDTDAVSETVAAEGEQQGTEAAPRVHEDPPRV